MNRLTRRLNNGKELCIDVCGEQCVDGYTWCPKCKPFSDVMKKLAEYESLEEQGMLLRLPVPEGTTVYQLGYIYDCKFDYECPLHGDARDICVIAEVCENEEKVWKVEEIPFIWKMLKSVGHTIFLTKEEAEQALAKMKEV